MMLKGSRLLQCFFFIFAVCISNNIYAQVTEDQVIAAYLYNFGKFVDWPENRIKRHVNLCIWKDNDFRMQIKNLGTKQIRGKPLRLRLVRSTEGIKHCHILYFPSEYNLAPEHVQEAYQHHVLLVGLKDNFTQQNGMIQIKKVGSHLKLKIGLKSAQKADLKVSSKLLKIATDID